MNRRSNLAHALARALLPVSAAVFLSAAFAADPQPHVRGTIVSFAADQLVVQTKEGNRTFSLQPATRIAGVVPSSLDQIKSGTYVGIANVPGADVSSALEVVVFPEAMKGAGLGDYAWDLAPPASAGGARSSAMTNGTVKSSATPSGVATTSAMTNGTVKATSGSKEVVLTVDYGKGEKKITVQPGVPVVGILPGDRGKLVPGAHVFIAPNADAPTTASFVAVGIDGTVPPM
ncbi:MAG: metal ABC transporter permease [Pseudomonadota bacterium]|nr:metal ABC transporter permease [Pseudomonadota bacterium]